MVGGFYRTIRVLAALDLNHDLVLSADEIANASAALRSLDRNHDGALEEAECVRQRPDLEADPMRSSPALAALDLDHDGILSAKEIRQSASSLRALDKDHNGRLTPEELLSPVGQLKQDQGGAAAMKFLLFASALFASAASAQSPKFEVASIRPVKTCDPGGGGNPGQLKSGPAPSAAPVVSPDRLVRCGPVSMLITIAYLASSAKGTQANPMMRLIPNIPIEGGPDWVRSDTYMIIAKSDRPVSRDVMEGTMLQELLEDRFKLKVHRASKMGPAYALTVAKGGPKLRKSTCTPSFGPDTLPQGRTPCPLEVPVRKGTVLAVDSFAQYLSELCVMLPMYRPVIDRTGLHGVFDFHIEFAPDHTSPFFQSRLQQLTDTGASDPSGRALHPLTALREQLGLKLDPVDSPREFLMIDSIERPSAN